MNDDRYFLQSVKNQKEYFINNKIPKFNKNNMVILHKIYMMYDVLINNIEIENLDFYKYCKTLTNKLVKDITREQFYDIFITSVNEYNKSNAINKAKNSTYNLNLIEFENRFLNKQYSKKELVKYFVEENKLNKEIFKNKESIMIFLNNLGYNIKRYGNDIYIRKL